MIDLDQVNVHDSELTTVIDSFINYLNTDARLAEIVDKFYPEWPEAHEDEFEITLAAHTIDSLHTPIQPRIESTQPITNDPINLATTYVIGKYDISMQVDIWAPYKEKRNEIYNKFYEIINEEFMTKDGVATGLSLTLENYFDTIARYDIIGYNFPDSERSSQDDDWRATVKMQVHFDRKIQKSLPKFTQITLVDSDTVTGEEYISESVVINENE